MHVSWQPTGFHKYFSSHLPIFPITVLYLPTSPVFLLLPIPGILPTSPRSSLSPSPSLFSHATYCHLLPYLTTHLLTPPVRYFPIHLHVYLWINSLPPELMPWIEHREAYVYFSECVIYVCVFIWRFTVHSKIGLQFETRDFLSAWLWPVHFVIICSSQPDMSNHNYTIDTENINHFHIWRNWRTVTLSLSTLRHLSELYTSFIERAAAINFISSFWGRFIWCCCRNIYDVVVCMFMPVCFLSDDVYIVYNIYSPYSYRYITKLVVSSHRLMQSGHSRFFW